MTASLASSRSAERFAVIAAALFLSVAILFTSCSSNGDGDGRPEALLHDDSDQYALTYGSLPFELDISSPQGFVYDLQSDSLVFAKGEEKVVYPGSITKLLTALYALTVLPLDAVITAGDELAFVKEGSSIAYIKEGHQLTVEMLIEGMLIPSGNDAAYVLAAAVGRALSGDAELSAQQALDAFLTGVNGYAAKLGLCGTHVTAPDGYADAEHYTTIEDLAILARRASENEIISKYAACHEDFVTYASGHINTWTNTNLLIDEDSSYYSPCVSGLKTGSAMGEYSLLFVFTLSDGSRFIGGVFGSNEKSTRYADALEIIERLERESGES